MNNIVIITLFACLAVAYCTPTVTGFQHGANVVPLVQKEARLIEAPTFGSLIWKGIKAVGFLIKSGWSLVALKVGAIVLIANIIIWGLKHSFSIILGAVGMLGFCKLTGKCSWAAAQPVYDVIGDTLIYAARHLDAGNALYDNDELAY